MTPVDSCMPEHGKAPSFLVANSCWSHLKYACLLLRREDSWGLAAGLLSKYALGQHQSYLQCRPDGAAGGDRRAGSFHGCHRSNSLGFVHSLVGPTRMGTKRSMWKCGVCKQSLTIMTKCSNFYLSCDMRNVIPWQKQLKSVQDAVLKWSWDAKPRWLQDGEDGACLLPVQWQEDSRSSLSLRWLDFSKE